MLVRGHDSVRLPARFQLVAAMNPCPCGVGRSSSACVCGDGAISRYWRRVSGPLLDRIDLFIGVDRVPLDRLITGSDRTESSSCVQQRVAAARDRQAQRMADLQRRLGIAATGSTNASLPGPWLRHACPLSTDLQRRCREAAEKLRLSARGWHRVLRLARTAADLARQEQIGEQELQEALQYRQPASHLDIPSSV